MSEEMSLLLPFESYEENAVNIGTQQKSADMARFIERVREDGLYLLDVNMTDSRIRMIAEFLNKYDPSRIMVVSARQYGQRPARQPFFSVFSSKYDPPTNLHRAFMI